MLQEFHLQILDKIYFELARNWMEMKFQAKTKAEAVSGLYKFRSRDFKIENVMEVDISALAKYFPNDSFSEWQDYLADDDMKLMVNLHSYARLELVNPLVYHFCFFFCFPQTQTDQDEENLEDDWDLIQEHLENIYITHNELFGFCDLSEKVSKQPFLYANLQCCIRPSRNSFVSNKMVSYIQSVRFCITDNRRLDSFTDSYELGVNMIKGDHQTLSLAVV